MKKYLLCFLALLLPAIIRAQDSFRIDEIGFGPAQVYEKSRPTPVRIHVPPLPASQNIFLELQFQASETEGGPPQILPDRYVKTLKVGQATPMDIVIPVYPPDGWKPSLHLVVSDASGRRIGEATREISTEPILNNAITAIYCPEDANCIKAESQLSVAIGEVEHIANRNWHVVTRFQRPYDQWWAYGEVDTLILPCPITNLSADQRSALEIYLRAGGTLVLLEKEITDKSFLAPYRQAPASGESVLVGRGRLVRIASLDSGGLSHIFRSTISKEPFTGLSGLQNGEFSRLLAESAVRGFGNSWNGVWEFAGSRPDMQLLDRYGVTFTFPRLRWLIIWLSTFILVVGPLNFVCLQRLRKLEWGWVSIPAIALLFAVTLYITSSERRPKEYTLDNVAAYWMDGKSPLAVAHYGLRIYSPEHRSVSVSIPENLVFYNPTFRLRGTSGSGVDIGVEFSRNHYYGPGVELNFDTRSATSLPMWPWSTEDFFAIGPRTFPGTLHWISPMHLKNDTGLTFQRIVYFDYKTNRQYWIPVLSPGEVVDLNSMETKPARDEHGESLTFDYDKKVIVSRNPAMVMTLNDLVDSGLHSQDPGQLFVGRTNGPVVDAGLDIPVLHRPTYAVFIVALEQQ